jgi:hypothetical protein
LVGRVSRPGTGFWYGDIMLLGCHSTLDDRCELGQRLREFSLGVE